MNEALQQIANACIPVLCLLITTGGIYLVTLLRKKTAQIQQQIDNDKATKYMGMASDAVAQAVAFTAQTYVDALKKDGSFTKENQLEAFNKAKAMTFKILGAAAVEALDEIYNDFDAWIDTKIEEACRLYK